MIFGISINGVQNVLCMVVIFRFYLKIVATKGSGYGARFLGQLGHLLNNSLD